MSDDLYELQRERERDLQRELDSKGLDRELFKHTLDAKRTQLETGLLQRRLDAPMGESVREDILQWREDLLQALGQREIEEDDCVARLATEDGQTQLEPLRKHAAVFAKLHLIDGVEQLYAEIARRAESLQDLLTYQGRVTKSQASCARTDGRPRAVQSSVLNRRLTRRLPHEPLVSQDQPDKHVARSLNRTAMPTAIWSPLGPSEVGQPRGRG